MSGWKIPGVFVPAAAIVAVVIFSAISLTLQESWESGKTIFEITESLSMIVIATAGAVIALNSYRLQRKQKTDNDLSIKRELFMRITKCAISISAEMHPEPDKIQSINNLSTANSALASFSLMQMEAAHVFDDEDCDNSLDKFADDMEAFIKKYADNPETHHKRIRFKDYARPLIKHII